mgnify:CR=1 FL=1
MIRLINDNYDGVIVDETTLPENKSEFEDEISKIIDSNQNHKLLWCRILIEKSDFIPVLTKLGFEFHHCNDRKLMMVKRLSVEASIPISKNYMAGVGAVVIDDKKILVIRDKFSRGFRIPGGQIDDNETIISAVKREVFEETGVGIEFDSIIGIGHFRNGQFGESNLYLVCTARAISREIQIVDTSEIIEARWMDINEFINSEDTNNFNKSILKQIFNKSEQKFKERKIKLRVKDGEIFY